jgi:lipoprotein signal peptidase
VTLEPGRSAEPERLGEPGRTAQPPRRTEPDPHEVSGRLSEAERRSETAPSLPPEPPAIRRPTARVWGARFAWVALLVALDLWSKSAVFAWLGQRPPDMQYDAHHHARWLLSGEWLAFMLSWNPGMAWGIDVIPPLALVIGRALAVLALAWMLARGELGRRLFNAALVLILAGAAGNLWDNLSQGNLFSRAAGDALRVGQVRDFIDVYFRTWDWHFPTFNVADSCITVGAVLLLISSLRPAPAAHAGPR